MFVPAIPIGGLPGLRLLDRTSETQRAAFEQSPQIKRETDAFRERIAGIETAEDLVQDRDLLRVALGAFGLEDDIGKKAYLRKVLEEGSGQNSFAARISDSRFKQFSEAFGFGDPGGRRNSDPGFANNIIASFQERQFEVAVGQSSDALRLALNFRREMADIASQPSAEQLGWFQVMGQKPLRTVFETAFGLGSGFGKLPLDQQKSEFERRTQSITGSPSVDQFTDRANVEAVLDRYLILADTGVGGASNVPGSAAVQILAAGQINSSQSTINLLLARAG